MHVERPESSEATRRPFSREDTLVSGTFKTTCVATWVVLNLLTPRCMGCKEKPLVTNYRYYPLLLLRNVCLNLKAWGTCWFLKLALTWWSLIYTAEMPQLCAHAEGVKRTEIKLQTASFLTKPAGENVRSVVRDPCSSPSSATGILHELGKLLKPIPTKGCGCLKSG